jgi:hypothetical protein
MLPEENKALVSHYIEVVWNQRNIAALDELLANYQRYVSATSAPGAIPFNRRTKDSEIQKARSAART